jgi:hypothetical protein
MMLTIPIKKIKKYGISIEVNRFKLYTVPMAKMNAIEVEISRFFTLVRYLMPKTKTENKTVKMGHSENGKEGNTMNETAIMTIKK